MFDAKLRPLIDPPLNVVARALSGIGISANMITIAGLGPALGAMLAIAHHHYGAAMLLIAINRLFDGLDGAVARLRGPSDFGGYLDSIADYVFYLAVPLGFALARPANALPALLLVASFTLTAVSFLAYAAIAAKHPREPGAHGEKSFVYSAGIAEGGETIAAFAIMCLWPDAFAPIALGFAALCLLTVLQRCAMARAVFGR